VAQQSQEERVPGPVWWTCSAADVGTRVQHVPEPAKIAVPSSVFVAHLRRDPTSGGGSVLVVSSSWIFGHRLRQAGLLGSMGRVASSVDNTMMAGADETWEVVPGSRGS